LQAADAPLEIDEETTPSQNTTSLEITSEHSSRAPHHAAVQLDLLRVQNIELFKEENEAHKCEDPDFVQYPLR
jgi:hypothetical protein